MVINACRMHQSDFPLRPSGAWRPGHNCNDQHHTRTVDMTVLGHVNITAMHCYAAACHRAVTAPEWHQQPTNDLVWDPNPHPRPWLSQVTITMPLALWSVPQCWHKGFPVLLTPRATGMLEFAQRIQ